MAPVLSLDDLVAQAEQVLADLNDYRAKEFPERPEILTYDDGQLVTAYKANERGDKLSREAKEQLRYFATWRAAVWGIEQKHAGNLTLLLGTISTFEAADRFEESQQIRQFVRTEYFATIPELCPMAGSMLARKFCERFAENRTVLPLWLRTMQKPPPGRGTRAAAPSSYHDDDPPEQGRLDYAEDE